MKWEGEGILHALGNYVNCGQETKHIRKSPSFRGKRNPTKRILNLIFFQKWFQSIRYLLGSRLGQDKKKTCTFIWHGHWFLTCKNVITEVWIDCLKSLKWPEWSHWSWSCAQAEEAVPAAGSGHTMRGAEHSAAIAHIQPRALAPCDHGNILSSSAQAEEHFHFHEKSQGDVVWMCPSVIGGLIDHLTLFSHNVFVSLKK